MGKTLAKGIGLQAVGRRQSKRGFFPRAVSKTSILLYFPHNLGSGRQHVLIKLADDTKPGSNINSKD